MRLLPFLLGRWRRGVEPWLDGGVLRIEMREIRHEILDDRHMRQRVDADRMGDLVHALGAGEGVSAVNIHRAGAANPLAAGTAEGERRVDLCLDPDDTVEHHRTAIIAVDIIGIEARIALAIGIISIDAELRQMDGIGGLRPNLAVNNAGVFREGEFNHGVFFLCSPLYMLCLKGSILRRFLC